METVEVLIAGADIGLGQSITGDELRWQIWPAAAAGLQLHSQRGDRPDAINQFSGSIARSPFMAANRSEKPD